MAPQVCQELAAGECPARHALPSSTESCCGNLAAHFKQATVHQIALDSVGSCACLLELGLEVTDSEQALLLGSSILPALSSPQLVIDFDTVEELASLGGPSIGRRMLCP